MFFYTYILQSLKDNSFYIGYTSDLKKRLEKHNSGTNLATKPHIPYRLIFYEAFLNRTDAKNREKYLKGGYGRITIKALLKRYFEKYFKSDPGRAFFRKHEIIRKIPNKNKQSGFNS